MTAYHGWFSQNRKAVTVIFLCAVSVPVQAQVQPPELITVTATKREENIHRVDISLSVIDAEEIQNLNLLSLPELASLAQNVSLFEDFPGAGIPTWVIRGVGLQDFNSNNTPAAAVLRGQRNDDTCISFASVNQRIFNERDPEVISLQSGDGRNVYSDPLNRQGNDYVSTLLELTVDLQGMVFQSLSTWDKFGYGVDLDLDGSEGEYGHRLSNSDIRVFSQEFRLLSAADAPLQWLAGISWSDEEFVERRDFNLRDNRLVGLGQGKLQYDQDTTSLAVYADAS